jgi:hypothetical protein
MKSLEIEEWIDEGHEQDEHSDDDPASWIIFLASEPIIRIASRTMAMITVGESALRYSIS